MITVANQRSSNQTADTSVADRLARRLSIQWTKPVSVECVHRLSAGLSWNTFAVEGQVAGQREDWILKLGPMKGLMAPYSAQPQALAALTFLDSGVKVAPVRDWSDDTNVLGGPFLLCNRMPGEALSPFANDYGVADTTTLPLLGQQFAHTLARVHTQAWTHGPMAKLAGAQAEPEVRNARSFALAEIALWKERANRWSTQRMPMLELAGRWLEVHCPENGPACVVHGDYRVGNFLAVGAEMGAVLDWEMVHLGDPHEDIAWASMPEFRLAGLIDNAKFQAEYVAAGGFELSRESIDYYTVFCLYKLAVINIGASFGFGQGATDLRLACLGLTVDGYLRRLARALSASMGTS